MDFTTVFNFIGSVGFPVVMCMVLFTFMSKEQETHKEEMEKMLRSLDNNTQAINELKIYITSLKNNNEKGD